MPASRLALRGIRDVVRDVRGAGRMAPEHDLARVAAVPRDVRLEPRDGRRKILDAGRPGALRRQPIVQRHADEISADGPEADVVVERRAFRALRAARETAAVHEHDHGLAAAWPRSRRREHVERVALVRAVLEVARRPRATRTALSVAAARRARRSFASRCARRSSAARPRARAACRRSTRASMCHRCVARRCRIRQARARRTPRHGMRIVERDLVDGREHLERERRRRIGRKRAARPRHSAARAASPAAVVAGRPRVERVVDAELPDAVLFDELVLVQRRAHRRARPEVQLLHHARAHLGRLAVGRHVNHRLVLHVVAEPAFGRAFLAEHVEQERAHALAADVDAALRELDRAVHGEQIREIVPEILVEVVAVRARQIVDLVEILDARRLAARPVRAMRRPSAAAGGRAPRAARRPARARPRSRHRSAGRAPRDSAAPRRSRGCRNGTAGCAPSDRSRRRSSAVDRAATPRSPSAPAAHLPPNPCRSRR